MDNPRILEFGFKEFCLIYQNERQSDTANPNSKIQTPKSKLKYWNLIQASSIVLWCANLLAYK